MFSKRLTPYNKATPANIQQQSSSIIGQLAATVLNEEIESNRAMLECLGELAEQEEKLLEEMVEGIRMRERE